MVLGAMIRMTEGQRGTLEYFDDGRMRVVIDRELTQLQALGLSPRLVHLHYSGRYEADVQSSLVYHHVEEADDSKRVGQILIRHFQISGDQLHISGVGLEGQVRLVWVREDSAALA